MGVGAEVQQIFHIIPGCPSIYKHVILVYPVLSSYIPLDLPQGQTLASIPTLPKDNEGISCDVLSITTGLGQLHSSVDCLYLRERLLWCMCVHA